VHILSQIEAHAPNKERYSLIAKVVNVGVALLIYGLDDGIARKVTDVRTQWIGCGPMYMGNKGAVGVRFCVDEEVFTYVSFDFSYLLGYETLFLGSFAHISLRMNTCSSPGSETIITSLELYYSLTQPHHMSQPLFSTLHISFSLATLIFASPSHNRIRFPRYIKARKSRNIYPTLRFLRS
jgi:hypothetical protein